MTIRAVLYVVWALFTAAAAYVLWRSMRDHRERLRTTADWPRVQATVTGSRTGWTTGVGHAEPNLRHFATYRFTGPGGRDYTGESEVSSVHPPEPGTTIEVAHDPADPSSSLDVRALPETRTVLGCLVVFFAVFAVVSFWFVGVFPLP